MMPVKEKRGDCVSRFEQRRRVTARFRTPESKKAPGASTRTSQLCSEELPDTFSAVLPRGAFPRWTRHLSVTVPGIAFRLSLPFHAPEGSLPGNRSARRFSGRQFTRRLPGSRPRQSENCLAVPPSNALRRVHFPAPASRHPKASRRCRNQLSCDHSLRRQSVR